MRVTVKGGGCSGMSYNLTFDNPTECDILLVGGGGGGGGGGASGSTDRSGGDGVLIIRTLSTLTTTGTVTATQDGNFNIYTFTGNGTFVA
mgnify:CR=1 FL=1